MNRANPGLNVVELRPRGISCLTLGLDADGTPFATIAENMGTPRATQRHVDFAEAGEFVARVRDICLEKASEIRARSGEGQG